MKTVKSLLVGLSMTMATSLTAQAQADNNGYTEAKLETRVPPVMPDRIDRSGRCYIGYDVSAAGQAINIDDKFCTASSLSKASINAVRQWEFKPAMIGNEPVASGPYDTMVRFVIADVRGRPTPEPAIPSDRRDEIKSWEDTNRQTRTADLQSQVPPPPAPAPVATVTPGARPPTVASSPAESAPFVIPADILPRLSAPQTPFANTTVQPNPSTAPSNTGSNSAFEQEMKQQIAALEAEIAALKAQMNAIAAFIAQ